MLGQSLGWEYTQGQEMATHCSTFAWNTPWTEGAWWAQSMGLQRAGYDWSTEYITFSSAVHIIKYIIHVRNHNFNTQEFNLRVILNFFCILLNRLTFSSTFLKIWKEVIISLVSSCANYRICGTHGSFCKDVFISSSRITFSASFHTVNFCQFSSVESLSHVRFFASPQTAAHPASLSIINSQSLHRLMSIELVMPSNHLIP